MSAPEVVSANEHYDALLAEHYGWMCGPHDAKVAQQVELFRRLGIGEGAGSDAVDLGCGTGFQSIALAQLGYRVTAVDANAQLLAELEQHRGELPVRAVEHDLCDLRSCDSLPASAELVVCMGDTLTHLPSHEAVANLFADVAGVLARGGKFVLGFRDMSREMRGVDRFIPVRADDDRIMTCFLEYEERTVAVHDLIYVRDADKWSLRKSAYRKLRLSIADVCDDLRAAGFVVASQEEQFGMWTVVAEPRP